MTNTEFKEEMKFYLTQFDEELLEEKEREELKLLIRIIDLLEEDVIVKTEDRNFVVEDIELRDILFQFKLGRKIIKVNEV